MNQFTAFFQNRIAILTVLSLLIPASVDASDSVNHAISETDQIMTEVAKGAVAPDSSSIVGKVSFSRATRLRRNELANVVVYIKDASVSGDMLESYLAEHPHPKMGQKDMTYVPRVLPVLVGEQIDFANSDPIYHSVYSTSPQAPAGFNFGIQPGAAPQMRKFDKPGFFEIRCLVHAEMEAHIVVLSNPYFAVAAKDGSFKIEGVPAGQYTLEFWHPDAEPVEAKVTVKDGQPTEISAEFVKRSN